MNLVLLGYRGSGKSTVGRLLADRLGMTFVDTDDRVIQHFAGMTIRDIWQTRGEPCFRKAEREQIQIALNNDHQVIAPGGGAAMQSGVRQSLEAAAAEGRCLRIYLRAKAQTLYDRIHADPATAANRPGLTTSGSEGSGSGGDLNEVQSVLAEREPTYLALADLIVDVDEMNVVHIVEHIADFINQR
ncbi:MAG: shikimate kinase [Phycisphaerales bacterium]